MSTEFKQCVAAVDEFELLAATLLSETVPVQQKKQNLDACKVLIEAAEPRIARLKKKADEKDPDKQVYGEKMTERVLALFEKFGNLTVLCQDAEPAVEALWAPHAAAAREKEEQRRQEEAEMEEAEKAARTRAEEMERKAAQERREREQREEEERKARYEAACRAAAAEQERQRQEFEEEKRARAELEAFLNATPARVLLKKGVKTLHAHCVGRHTLRTFDDTIRSLHQFAKNLAGHPDSAALKHLRYSNENFSKEILSRGEGSLLMLYSLGYRPAGFGENQFLILEEINPVSRYDEWEAWWEEVKWTRDYLGDLIESLRQHRRGVAEQEYDINRYLPVLDETAFLMDQSVVPVVATRPDEAYYT